MRNLLLAGVALGAVTAMVSATTARAQEAPAAVFPVTTETDLAGYNGPSLNGAAPGSVQVNLGGRTFSALWFQSSFLKGTPGWAKPIVPDFNYWFFLYPGFDYASPSGIHFGAQAEMRVTSTAQGAGSGGNINSPVPFFHQAFTYVSSPVLGKVQFGIPSGALVANSVGTSDDFGTGTFFSWYNPGVPWTMADAPDNYITNQKVVYTSPTFAGFLGAVSFQPAPTSLNWFGANTQGMNPATFGGTTFTGGLVDAQGTLLSKNRIEMVVKYSGTFGGLGLSADGGYVFSGAEKSGAATVAQDVSYGNFGVKMTYAGLELEGSVNTGKFNVAIVDNGNPDGPLPLGAKGSTTYVAAVGYQTGPFKAGLVYYGGNYDQGDFTGGTIGNTGHFTGYGLGASYTVGPGVVAYLDATTSSIDEGNWAMQTGGPGAAGATFGKQHPAGLGVGTFFTW